MKKKQFVKLAAFTAACLLTFTVPSPFFSVKAETDNDSWWYWLYKKIVKDPGFVLPNDAPPDIYKILKTDEEPPYWNEEMAEEPYKPVNKYKVQENKYYIRKNYDLDTCLIWYSLVKTKKVYEYIYWLGTIRSVDCIEPKNGDHVFVDLDQDELFEIRSLDYETPSSEND